MRFIVKFILVTFIILPLLVNSQSQIGQDIDGEAAGDYSGHSVSLSSNGNIIAIGAYRNDAITGGSGHVRIYENIGGTWTQIGNDIEGKSFTTLFGYSVSLSSDGSIVAIGAIANAGYVRVFKNVSGNWTQIGSDIDGVELTGQFGQSVSLSSDGSIIAVGAPDHPLVPSHGYVRIFKNESDIWTQIGDSIKGEASGDHSGWSVSLSSDGNIVAIGATHNSGGIGHVRVYEEQLGVWTQLGEDIDGEAIGYSSGHSVNLSSDGSILAIGSPDNQENGIQRGHVRVYKYESGSWTQIGSDIDGEAQGDRFGWSVSLSSVGNILAIGGIDNDGNGDATGHVRIFKNQSGTWAQMGNSINGEAIDDHSGWSVCLSSDAGIVAIGAFLNDDNGEDSGHVRVYDLSSTLSSDDFVLSKFSLFPNPAKNEFTIKLPEGLELQDVTIYNSLGQFIKSTNNNIINTSELSTGIYYVEITTNKGKASKKIVVN